MKISTADNIRKRIHWLQSIWDGRVIPTKSQQEKMTDMKAFCTLTVPNEFDKISYNTLKNFCTDHSFPEVSHSSKNLWEHMRFLRTNIYLIFNQTAPDDEIKTPSAEIKINEAFNQAQLATYAYLELFRFLKTLVESDTGLNYATKAQITNFLFESSVRFEGINTTPTLPPKAWSVIQGGKGDV